MRGSQGPTSPASFSLRRRRGAFVSAIEISRYRHRIAPVPEPRPGCSTETMAAPSLPASPAAPARPRSSTIRHSALRRPPRFSLSLSLTVISVTDNSIARLLPCAFSALHYHSTPRRRRIIRPCFLLPREAASGDPACLGFPPFSLRLTYLSSVREMKKKNEITQTHGEIISC